MAAITLAACGGGSNSTPTAQTTPAAPNMASQAARLKEIKSITLASSTKRLDTGVTGSEATLQATALDSMGQPISGVSIHFEAYDLALIGPSNVETDAKGIATAKVTSAGFKYDSIHLVEVSPAGATHEVEYPSAQVELETTGSRVVLPELPTLHMYGSASIPIKVVGADGIAIAGVQVVPEIDSGIQLDLAKETDADGIVWLNVTDLSGTDHTIKIHTSAELATFVLKVQPLAPGELAMKFHESNSGISTGTNENSMSTMVHVSTQQGKPVVGAAVKFTASNGGVLSAQTVTTDETGTAAISVGAGADLSNRTITLVAEVQGSTAQMSVDVHGTTLTTDVAPLMSVLGKPVWNILAKDGAGNPIPNAEIQLSFSMLPAENSNVMTPIDPTSYVTVGAESTKPNPKLAAVGSATRTIQTNASGVAKIEFGTPTSAVVGKVIKVVGLYGAGKQAVSAKQHVYEGLLYNDGPDALLTANLLTETSAYRYLAKDWHRLFLLLDLVNLYEAPNAKGPLSRNDKCDATFSKITVRANGQDIFLRGKKLSNDKTCSMDWGGDFFGRWGTERMNYASSDFTIWYDASDNLNLPAGKYIAPMRLQVVESEPNSGKDIFWGTKDVVVFITKK